jgi:DNA-binding transcriptional LysR family regulator
MWEAVELREIRVFLTLADGLHFGRSGERLGLTTSHVSQSLRTLERKLGGPLVQSTSRHVALTPLGERYHHQLGISAPRAVTGGDVQRRVPGHI